MNKSKPFFSIIIPVYNRDKTISRAINSCLEQTFSDFEIIIVDDNSTDLSISKVESFSDPRIHLIKNNKNLERCISRNLGITKAKGKYVCFLDSDDYFLPDHLATFHDFILQNKIKNGMLFTNSFIESEDGRSKKIVPQLSLKNKFEYLLKYTPNPARVCVSREILLIDNFDVLIPGIEDLELWLRIAKGNNLYHIERFTNVYFHHDESYTSGDKDRYSKELKYFNYLQSKKELVGCLPKHSINRLKSMCHFHMAMAYINQKEKLKFYRHAISSFFLYPKGYNGKTNPMLLLNALYALPLIGILIQFTYRTIKRKTHA